MGDDTSSPETGSDHGFFRRHWKAVAAVGSISTVISIGALFAALGWYDPRILSILLSWPMLILGMFAGLTLLAGFVIYWYGDTGSVTAFVRRTTGDAANQLTAYDAQKLAEWIVYDQHHILVGQTTDSGVVPVTTADEGVTTRIFEWRFTEKNSADDYVFLLDMEQELDFDPEYIEKRTPENLEKLNAAVRTVYNTRLLTNPDTDEITDARESLGNSVRRQEDLAFDLDFEYDLGQSRVEHRDPEKDWYYRDDILITMALKCGSINSIGGTERDSIHSTSVYHLDRCEHHIVGGSSRGVTQAVHHPAVHSRRSPRTLGQAGERIRLPRER